MPQREKNKSEFHTPDTLLALVFGSKGVVGNETAPGEGEGAKVIQNKIHYRHHDELDLFQLMFLNMTVTN